MRDILSAALVPPERLLLGDALASLGGELALTDDDVDALGTVHDQTAARSVLSSRRSRIGTADAAVIVLDTHVSASLAELLCGIGALTAGARKNRLSQALDRLLALFPGRVLPFDQDAARKYTDMAVTARAAGRPLPVADGYVAATAAARGFAVATRNIQHFGDTGVELIDPWRDH